MKVVGVLSYRNYTSRKQMNSIEKRFSSTVKTPHKCAAHRCFSVYFLDKSFREKTIFEISP